MTCQCRIAFLVGICALARIQNTPFVAPGSSTVRLDFSCPADTRVRWSSNPLYGAILARTKTVCADGKVRVFDIAQTKAIAEFDAKNGVVHRLVWSDDGSSIAAASLSGAIAV